MEHHFNVEIAKDYGIEEAILLNNFHFWIAKNMANGMHYHDGLCWFYNSKKAFVELFPYMNETKIFRAIKKLEERGLVVKGNYNTNKWDKTNWYAFTKKGIKYMRSKGCLFPSFQNDTLDSVKMNNGALQSEQSYNTYNKPDNNIKEKDSKEKEKLQEFVDKIYGMYPSKCTVRNVSTGKCRKDKERIIKLMNNYSMEEIEMVVKHEVDSKLGKHPLKNFSTFLNNFPDPKEISETLYYPKSIEDVKDDDIKPTFTLFLDWLDDAAKKILETNRKGFPVNEKQYQRLIDVAIGGKRTLAYVTLVLNRDGYGVYEDERGFMLTYLNYIKANGLYKG